MTPAEQLKSARERISDPAHWGKKRFNLDGVYCALGALLVARDGDMDEACEYLRRACDCESIIVWNDVPSRTHAEVLAAFDRAIELARAV